MKKKEFMPLFLCLALAAIALGQSDRGTVTGTVIDPQGAPVPLASIVMTNVATRSQWTAQTTNTGSYTIMLLPAGVYELSMEHPGFQKFLQTGIRVLVAQTARVEVALTIGSLTESVTVTADASLLKTESAEQSVVLTSNMLSDLPLKFTGFSSIRDPWAFVSLSTGVSGSDQGDMKVNGSPGNQFRILLEGQQLSSARSPGSSQDQQPSIDAIEEFTLQTSGFAAEYGQVGAGLINMTSKSGTNQFHGSAYEIMANEAFNAASPFTHLNPASRQHDFGGSIGGPVRIPKVYNGSNRSFFFFNYEKYKYNFITSGVRSVPSDAYRRGDFSYLLTGRTLNTDGLGRPILEGTIYDPASDFTVDGKVYRNAYPRNEVPERLFDPIALKILNLMPKQNLNVPGDVPVNNFQYADPAFELMYVPSIKIDHNITP